MNPDQANVSTADVLSEAARIAGIDCHGAELIRDGSHVIYRLGDIVARIGQRGSDFAARRELRISRWLNECGIATVESVAGLKQPVIVAERPVTWWRLIPEHRPSTPGELGAMLHDLHQLTAPADLALPDYEPFAGLYERLATADEVGRADRQWLLQHYTELRTRHDDLPTPAHLGVIHGDAWQGNLVVPTSGIPTVLDLDKVSLGRREWDLIQLAVDYTDFRRITAQDYRAFVDAYGGYDVTAWPGFRLLADVQELRWAAFAVERSRTSPQAAAQAAHRIACLRGQVARPWRWDAL
ncbi:Phosphotransferase enzyme family protein [Nocardia amikacinitolerans]|uniref:phosphotransferase n=1 Tax=Nocardia amikacinitolerans TaxID=756689 RepID=UPI0020A5AA0D|nr:aminoglycoside phosphotransferase family protein [Nocardia amikacinitolerans]MCP2297584.1 Phosphotransferase enzyme family protein [Nocardia amikacinitolerans]